MDKIAQLNGQERRDLFLDTANKKNFSAAIVEKDFWVCWALGRIFADKELNKILCFKGGTSLSKVFKVIERFSEDIDLILDWTTILKNSDTVKQPSVNKQDIFNKDIEARAEKYISTKLKAHIARLLSPVCIVKADENDGHILYITYPKTFQDLYIRHEIKLEIGPLAAWVPNDRYPVNSYVAEVHKELPVKEIIVPAIKAERTFWEKATILHREYYRSQSKGHTPPRYSRHYYDLFKMGNSKIKDTALANMKLLADVVEFKDRFYHCAWARYDLAKNGSLHLYPNDYNLDVLAEDYKNMRNMIFGEYPNWKDILKYLSSLEKEINKIL
jgi:predicted nucleotidyltransferase component of viral defense system